MHLHCPTTVRGLANFENLLAFAWRRILHAEQTVLPWQIHRSSDMLQPRGKQARRAGEKSASDADEEVILRPNRTKQVCHIARAATDGNV